MVNTNTAILKQNTEILYSKGLKHTISLSLSELESLRVYVASSPFPPSFFTLPGEEALADVQNHATVGFTSLRGTMCLLSQAAQIVKGCLLGGKNTHQF